MLLSVRDLSIRFGPVEPVSGLSFDLDRGQIIGLVGESGSGKSLTAMAVAGLLPLVGGRIAEGRILFDGTDLARLPEAGLRAYRGRRIGVVTQNPMTALDPAQRIGEQVEVVARLHRGLSRQEAHQATIELLTALRIPEAGAICDAYPHQLSGGMKQRIVIAMALAGEPDLLIADEPTTALDVTVQAGILDLVRRLRDRHGSAVVFITHDMGVVSELADRVMVMYAGRIVEKGARSELFGDPLHPYTRALMGSIPPLTGERPRRLPAIPGSPPSLLRLPQGCSFAPRCPVRFEACEARPALPAGARAAACFRVEEFQS